MFGRKIRRSGALLSGLSSYLITSSLYFSTADGKEQVKSPPSYDIVIIGAGVVGLSVARSCAIQTNATILLIDKEDVVASGVSARNSGLGCTGYDAPIGSLERRLLRRSIRLHQNLYRSFGLSHQHVRKCGSLVVAWNETELAKLPEILQENRDAGDEEAVLLTQEELRKLEPNLSHQALGAVYCPYESVTEPWLVPMGYAESARLNGVAFQLGTEVADIRYNKSSKQWDIQMQSTDLVTIARSKSGELLVPPGAADRTPKEPQVKGSVSAKVIINCAGLHSDEIEAMIRSNCESQQLTTHSQGSFRSPFPTSQHPSGFKITPRKGQFLVYKLPQRQQGQALGQLMTIEPVATQFTKGVILWQTLYGNVIVGPTADDVLEKDDYATDTETLRRLQQFGEKVYPLLKEAEVIGSYSGLRPASEYRDYQIYSNTNENKKWITVGGIRSTGLTASSGIGEYVTELYCQLLTSSGSSSSSCSPQQQRQNRSFLNDLSEEDISADGLLGVSVSAQSPLALKEINHTHSLTSRKQQFVVPCPAVPPLESLAQDFQHSLSLLSLSVTQDKTTTDATGAEHGSVNLYGKRCRVTHPITSFGLESFPTGQS